MALAYATMLVAVAGAGPRGDPCSYEYIFRAATQWTRRSFWAPNVDCFRNADVGGCRWANLGYGGAYLLVMFKLWPNGRCQRHNVLVCRRPDRTWVYGEPDAGLAGMSVYLARSLVEVKSDAVFGDGANLPMLICAERYVRTLAA